MKDLYIEIMYIRKKKLIEKHWTHFLFLSMLCPLMFNASTQKVKFSMNCHPPFFALFLFSSILTRWRRQWHPTPVLLPRKSHAEEPGRLRSMGSLRVGHDWKTSLSLFTYMHWRRKWQPTPAFLPGESQGQGSLKGCRLGVTQSRTQLKWLSILTRC